MTYEFHEITGNLIKIEADFIVNASNTRLILGSGVSMAFKRHCGIELQHEMDQVRMKSIQEQSPIQQGDVVATSSGRASNFMYALHAAVINYNKGISQLEGKPTLKTIETILLNTEPYLQWFSDQFDKKSTIIFPYLGCGVGGLNKTEVHNVFKEFCKKNIEFDCAMKLCDFPNR